MAEVMEPVLVTRAINSLEEAVELLTTQNESLYKSLQALGMKVYQNEQALHEVIKQLELLTKDYANTSRATS